MNNDLHFGNFSSSEIVRLTGAKKVRETYIKEKNVERKLGRVVKTAVDTKDMAWGHLMELRCFTLLDTSYSLVSDKTIRHPTVKCWVGSPDGIRHITEKTVIDIKGLGLLNFCEMVDAFKLEGITKVREDCKDGEKFYWQIVSNACLTACGWGELILYCPYQSELDAIRSLAGQSADPRFKRFAFAYDDELPYLVEGCEYQNINKFRFKIPDQDKLYLHALVEEAEKELIPYKTPVNA